MKPDDPSDMFERSVLVSKDRCLLRLQILDLDGNWRRREKSLLPLMVTSAARLLFDSQRGGMAIYDLLAICQKIASRSSASQIAISWGMAWTTI